jgi:hypothetical protein
MANNRASAPPRATKARAASPTKPKGREKPPKPAFPKKAEKPELAEFGATLPLAVGKRLQSVRAFLKKQKEVEESLFYFGAKSGWGLRYALAETVPLCSIFILGAVPLGIVALDEALDAEVDWDSMSEPLRDARTLAHGTPEQMWLDVPLDGRGASDFKKLMRHKIDEGRRSLSAS